MKRALTGMTPLVPAAVGASAFCLVSFAGTSLPSMTRALLAIVASVGLAFSAGWLLAGLVTSLRFRRLVRDAERIAAGELGLNVRARDGSSLSARLGRALVGIVGALRETHESATVDRLTGVSNRQALLGMLFAEVERATRYNRPFSVAFVDIDHFKTVNDTYGHATGDVVLRGVAQTIRCNLRATDTIGRYGGEEFMLLLTESDADEAAQLAEKLRALVARQRFLLETGQELQVTVSIGIAGGLGSNLRVDALVRDADAAMYSAKSLGRNQTYVFAEPDENARVPRAPISPAGRARAVELGRAAREAAVRSLATVLAPLSQHHGGSSPVMTSIVGAMAARLDLPESEIDRLRIAALLHDVGKMALPHDILEKPAPLTTAEWRSIVQHPRIGQVILEQAAAIRDAAPIVLHHHERYSGQGYPFGLRGTEIPLGARIVAIADAYDAMTNDRPFKAAMTHHQALEELRRHSGTQFDPELVELFCELYAVAAPEPDPSLVPLRGDGFALPSESRTAASPPTAALELPADAPDSEAGPRRRHVARGRAAAARLAQEQPAAGAQREEPAHVEAEDSAAG